MTHLSVLNTCESSSNNTEIYSNTEDVTKPSCSYAVDTRQRVSHPAANNNGKGRRRKVQRKTAQKRKMAESKESNSMTRYLSKCGLSGVEPLEASNDYSGEKSLKDKVCSWLHTLPGNENLLDPDVAERVDSDLDDTLTMSVSENDGQSKGITTDTNVDPSLEPPSTEACDKSDGDRSTCKEIPDDCSRNDKKPKGINPGNCSSRMDTKSEITKTTVRSSEEKFIEVQRTSPCDMLSSMQRNWSSVAKFGKEMRAKRKRLKSLDVSIENRGKRGSMGEAGGRSEVEEVGSRDRREGEECEKSLGKARYEALLDGERSILAEVEPAFGESSFVTLEGDGKIRIRSLNACQMNAIIGVSDEGNNEEGTERQMEVFNTPVHDRSKIFSQMIPDGSPNDDQDRGNLVDESVKNSPIPTDERTADVVADRPTPSKYQISTPSRKRLSLKRQSEDSKSSNTNAFNSDVGSRLNAVKRDLNRQIDKEEGNGIGKRKSTGDERERNLPSNDYAGRAWMMGDKKRNEYLVTFKKLGKFYKRGNEGRVKKRVPFFYLGATGKETSYYPGLHAHKSCNLACCNALKLEQKIDNESGTSVIASITDSNEVKSVEAAMKVKSKVKMDDRTVSSENRVEDVAARRISCEEIVPRPIGNANRSYDVDVLLVSSDDEPSTNRSPLPKTDSSCKDTVRMSSPSKDRSPQRFLSSSPPIDTLQTQKLNDPGSARRKRKQGNKRAQSFACISPNCNSFCVSIEKCSNRRTVVQEKETKESWENDSNHSLSSQATCIRATMLETKNSSRKNNSKGNERKRSPNPSSKDTEVVRSGENLDRDTVKTCEKKVREKVYNRIVLLDSSESESMDNFVFLDGNVDGNASDASPKTEKRKRTVSFDSADETDLNAIVNNWCNDGKLDERCKKKGKLERVRDTLDSSASRDNFSTKSLGNYSERGLPPRFLTIFRCRVQDFEFFFKRVSSLFFFQI